MQMNKGLPAIKRTVHAEEFKWVLALWALRGLLVGCPPQNACYAAYSIERKNYEVLRKRIIVLG